jgi:hypothetical protein
MNLDWLDPYEEETALGPIQREEALFLFALARVLRPQVVVEFGVAYGDSARAWLQAGVPLVIGIDPWRTPQAAAVEQEYSPRFRYRNECMTTAQIAEVPDLIFFDAEHDIQANVMAFKNLKTLPRMIAVHDTGTWAPEHMTPAHQAFPGIDTAAGKVHQPAEVLFCNMLERAGWQRIDLHSTHTLRHGITLLQRGEDV